jgi:hypothetical protein
VLESQAKMDHRHQLDVDKANQAKANNDTHFASVTGALGPVGSGLLSVGTNGGFQSQPVSVFAYDV